ncbi:MULTISPECIES: DUF3253 domain-containing protein [Asticcacaulis]|uniref:DUF3253 domain-containing protein n=1 Tax=Asticcacaulis benevestitus DSM 16100 = ATCC BAA-896 TaxID=1121022 RepID=V4RM38_9CAUL|nr:DUF3253 domain-containing protein [Asticcacaulis benevestitus]ESQ92338.1 hypothetical protein ABENE_09250 [Asticcacaulis benevestitus DSM 16100 = ATCC BAA-896]
MSQLIEETLLGLLSQVRDGESISPNDVAKAVNAEQWRRELPKVRGVIIGLARQGKLEVLRKGKPIEPEGFKGVYRVRLPQKA